MLLSYPGYAVRKSKEYLAFSCHRNGSPPPHALLAACHTERRINKREGREADEIGMIYLVEPISLQ
jgi:hypothetical protein